MVAVEIGNSIKLPDAGIECRNLNNVLSVTILVEVLLSQSVPAVERKIREYFLHLPDVPFDSSHISFMTVSSLLFIVVAKGLCCRLHKL